MTGTDGTTRNIQTAGPPPCIADEDVLKARSGVFGPGMCEGLKRTANMAVLRRGFEFMPAEGSGSSLADVHAIRAPVRETCGRIQWDRLNDFDGLCGVVVMVETDHVMLAWPVASKLCDGEDGTGAGHCIAAMGRSPAFCQVAAERNRGLSLMVRGQFPERADGIAGLSQGVDRKAG